MPDESILQVSVKWGSQRLNEDLVSAWMAVPSPLCRTSAEVQLKNTTEIPNSESTIHSLGNLSIGSVVIQRRNWSINTWDFVEVSNSLVNSLKNGSSRWQFWSSSHVPCCWATCSACSATFSWFWPIANIRRDFSSVVIFRSANFWISFVGSEPGERMKITGICEVDCSKSESKYSVGGMRYFSPMVLAM